MEKILVFECGSDEGMRTRRWPSVEDHHRPQALSELMEHFWSLTQTSFFHSVFSSSSTIVWLKAFSLTRPLSGSLPPAPQDVMGVGGRDQRGTLPAPPPRPPPLHWLRPAVFSAALSRINAVCPDLNYLSFTAPVKPLCCFYWLRASGEREPFVSQACDSLGFTGGLFCLFEEPTSLLSFWLHHRGFH